MNDLTGVGKIAEVIADALGKASGTLYEPVRIKREAKARGEALLIETQAEIEAQKMRDNALTLVPQESDLSLQSRAGQRVLQVELTRQNNLERIAAEGAAKASPDAKPRELDADWMSAFLQYAQDISADGVRELWSTILASQATDSAPAVSRATLDSMRLLEPQHAKLFERAIQLHIGVGAILDTQPNEGLHYSFNVNELLSMALEDIGLLRRSNDFESSLALQDSTLTFWNPWDLIGSNQSVDHPAAVHDLLTKIKMATGANRPATISKGRKSIRLSQMHLTARGFELAAAVYPAVYAGIDGHSSIRDHEEFGPYADEDIRASILVGWALDFSHLGAFVVKNNRVSGSELEPVEYFDRTSKSWCPID